MMGAESVEYHERTVLVGVTTIQGWPSPTTRREGRPRWLGRSGAATLGLEGAVTREAYGAVFGPGGACHPVTGRRLVTARRPGMELVISAHKSVAELGVIGRAEDMHRIMDAERDATLDYLDQVTRTAGGRRGRSATPTATSGLVYAHTRHATSRAGDPCPHDHVLLANVIEMADERGGWKAADTVLWREHLHAATMVGRVAAARTAVELGYGIEPDPGPSGRLRHWQIAGVPDEVIDVHSKRSAEIDAECERRGDSSSRARAVAARTTRRAKQETVEAELVGRWQTELAAIGWPLERLAASVDAAAARLGPPAKPSLKWVRHTLSEVLSPEGELARRKVFSRRHLLVELAPYLFGRDPRLLEVLVDRGLADPEVIPLVGVAGAREPAHTLASVLAAERAIADAVARQLGRRDASTVSHGSLDQAMRTAEQNIGGDLSAEQRNAAVSMCMSGRGAELVVGVAGAGKTTVLAVVAAAFEASGCQVIGTATSGQAARTLGREADITDARTLASLQWRLDHDQIVLDDSSVVILDEAGMTEDAHLVALTARVEAAGAKLIVVGDPHQLGAVGPGGALAALVRRHPDAVHQLVENRRQADPGERQALSELRAGKTAAAVEWYRQQGRVHPILDRDTALQQAVDAWAADTAGGHDTGLYAWRRANVAGLNQRARVWMETTGRLSGPELVCPGGRRYRAGDHVVTLTPGTDGHLVTSQRAVIGAVDPAQQTLTLVTDTGHHVHLGREAAGADRLDYGYATTVHRAQGATVTRAHLYADGGGQELAYVALSRARQSTQVWAVADDLPQALNDLRRDWSTRRTPTWALDATLPNPATLTPESFGAVPRIKRPAWPLEPRPRRPSSGKRPPGSACPTGPPPSARPGRPSTPPSRPGPTSTPAPASGSTPRSAKPSATSTMPAESGNKPNWRQSMRAAGGTAVPPASKPPTGPPKNSTHTSAGPSTWHPRSPSSTSKSPGTKLPSITLPPDSTDAKRPPGRSSSTDSIDNERCASSPGGSPFTATRSTAARPRLAFAGLPARFVGSRTSRELPTICCQRLLTTGSACRAEKRPMRPVPHRRDDEPKGLTGTKGASSKK